MKFTRKIALAAVSGLLGLGLVAVNAPAASAYDTSWGCPGCFKAPTTGK